MSNLDNVYITPQYQKVFNLDNVQLGQYLSWTMSNLDIVCITPPHTHTHTHTIFNLDIFWLGHWQTGTSAVLLMYASHSWFSTWKSSFLCTLPQSVFFFCIPNGSYLELPKERHLFHSTKLFFLHFVSNKSKYQSVICPLVSQNELMCGSHPFFWCLILGQKSASCTRDGTVSNWCRMNGKVLLPATSAALGSSRIPGSWPRL